MGEEERKQVVQALRHLVEATDCAGRGLAGPARGCRPALLDVVLELTQAKERLYSVLSLKDVAAEGVPDEG